MARRFLAGFLCVLCFLAVWPGAAGAGDVTRIQISAVGDVTLGGDPFLGQDKSFYKVYKNKGAAYFLGGVAEYLANDDLTIANLEGTLTNSTSAVKKAFRFKGLPAYTSILKKGSVEAVNIANNHIHDFGDRGYQDTKKNLRAAGIAYFGEGIQSIVEIDGVKVGMLGYTLITWRTRTDSQIAAAVRRLREKCDILIVSLHWGKEGHHKANSQQTRLGRACVDNGADLVLGHHPHVLQGIEQYKGKYIVYSLGNFCFGGNRNPSDRNTMIFQLSFRIQDGKVSTWPAKIIPCSMTTSGGSNDYRPKVLTGTQREQALSRIYSYSRDLAYGIKR